MERWKKNMWILWVTQIISLASFGFGLPFIPLYIQELEVLTQNQIDIYTAVLASTPAITMGIMAPIWGYVADHYGRKLMILRAMFMAIFIIGGMGFVMSVNQLLVLRLLQGVFTGTVTAAVAFVASNTPKEQLTYALGVITSSTFIGYSFGPMLGGAFAEVYGYANSFKLGGGLMIIGVILVLFLVKEDKSTLQKHSPAPKVSFFLKYKKVLIPSVVTVLFMLFFLRISRTLFSPYVARFVEYKYGTKEGVAFMTGLLNGLVGLATAFSSMFMGWLATRVNKMKMLSTLLFIGVIVTIILTQYKTLASWLNVSKDLWVFTIIYMIFFIIIGGVEPILTSTSAMSVPTEDRGGLFGLQGMVGSIAWFVAPAVAGTTTVKYGIEAILIIIPFVLGINFLLSYILRRKVEGHNT